MFIYRFFLIGNDYCVNGFSFLLLEEAKKRLKNAGYEQVLEREDWKLEAGKKYFFTRNYSTIVAFAIGKKYVFFIHFLSKKEEDMYDSLFQELH